jgi:hypothetical protein
MKHLKHGLAFLVLLGLNLAIFGGHYFADFGFPWDFPMGYYGFVAFWTAAVSKGIIPQWISFQQMGYPFALQTSSGFYYPPLWVFPLFRIQYTLHMAVVVQCLHVLLGSVGMYVYMKHVFRSTGLALVGAVIFQFFGGFYSNAEHVNIVRSFALSPWIMYVYTLDTPTSLRLPRRVLFIPLVLYLLAAGGYPTSLVSTGFIIGLYVFMQLADAHRKGNSLQQLIMPAIAVSGLTLLGVAMAVLPLGPMWVFRDQLARWGELQSLDREILWVQHLQGLFLSSKVLPGEPSMNSAYVTLPAVVFASFVPISKLRQYWVQTMVGLAGLLMVPGDMSFFFRVATRLIPPLGFSRFPSADYRVFIAIPIILFSVIGLRALMEREITWRGMVCRTAFTLLWFCLGVHLAYQGASNIRVFAAAAVVGATLLLLLHLWWRAENGRCALSKVVLVIIIALISLDALRVLPDIATWRMRSISSWYESFGWPYEKNHQLVTYGIFGNLPDRRPRRQETQEHWFSWGGYIDGRYMLLDKRPILLQRAEVAASNSVYRRYMLMQWSPLLLDPPMPSDEASDVLVPEGDLDYARNQESNTAGSVEQTHYGVNDISYQVSLKEPRLMVENEIYFPGWEARLIFGDVELKLQALAVNDVFRAWRLPAGDYEMVAYFQFPHFAVYQSVSLLAFVVWLTILVFCYVDRLQRYIPCAWLPTLNQT